MRMVKKKNTGETKKLYPTEPSKRIKRSQGVILKQKQERFVEHASAGRQQWQPSKVYHYVTYKYSTPYLKVWEKGRWLRLVFSWQAGTNE
jgi:hypothetical protein